MPIDITKEEVYSNIQKGVEAALKEYRREYLPSRVLVEMLDTWPEEDVELFLANYPETPSILLDRMACTSKNPEVLAGVAAHSRTAGKVMQDLAAHKDETVRVMLAANKQVSPQTAAALAEDESVLVRVELAKNPALPTRVQSHLLSDPAAIVRSEFCDIKNMDLDSLHKLLMDPDHLVKARAAMMAKVTDETLLKWADSDGKFIQLFLLHRKNLAPKVMESLSFSSHPEIQQQAINFKVLAEDEQLGWAGSEDVELRKSVASKEELTAKVQLILANDKELSVRELLAANRSINEETQKILAADPQGRVAELLLDINTLSDKALTTLCESCDEDKAFELAMTAELNDNQIGVLANKGSIELLYVLARRGMYSSSLNRERVVELVNSRMPTLVAFAIRSRHLKKEELARFTGHPCSSVRAAVVEHINADEEILATLLEDVDKSVSESAAEKLIDIKRNKGDQ